MNPAASASENLFPPRPALGVGAPRRFPRIALSAWTFPWAGFSASVAGIATITFCAYQFHANLTTAALLYLIVVVLLARHGGFWPASIVSLGAMVCQMYFLVPPAFSWVVADPKNWIALATFEYCALVVSRLSTTAVRQTLVAESRRRDTEGLYEVSRLVLLMDRRRPPGAQLTALIQRVFDCDAVVLFESESLQIDSAGATSAALEHKTRDAYLQARDWFDTDDRTWFRVLRMGAKPIGALALRGSRITELVANALASLVAVALERASSFEKESRVEAARQSEQLRTAVLDALAHDVKTPLTAIRAASSGLLEVGTLAADHRELVALIDDESARLDEITNRLLRMAKLDGRDVSLKRERVYIDALLLQTVAPLRDRAPHRSIRITPCPDDLSVLGDEQLIATALTQLIDNALKYSQPDSCVTVGAERSGAEVRLTVHNLGAAIPPAEIERVFERFYRATDTAHRVAGTGLGLSITRKIAQAHGGRVWVVSDEHRGTTFVLALPGEPEQDSGQSND